MKNDKKITIGLFNDSFYPMADGVISVVDNYARRLTKYANVIVFVPKYDKDFDDSVFPYKVVRCSSLKIYKKDYSLPIPDIDPSFKKKLRNYKLDIVHIHSPFTIGNAGLYYAKKHNIPCIGTMHSQFKQDFKRVFKSDYLASKATNIIIKFFNKCDECWAVNKEVARIYYEDYHYKTIPRVMDNATEMLPINNELDAINYINKKHNIKKNDKVFLFVGRLNLLKNIIFIADAIKVLTDLKPKFKFKMLYVGTGEDEKKLENHIKKLNLEKNIILCGKITDREELAKYFMRADLFLFPSVYDASSIVQIEAASQKTPGLFLEGTCTAATITNNVNGFLSENNIEAYANRIKNIIEDTDLYNKVKENCFKDLYINWDTQIDNVYNLYINAIKNKKQKKSIFSFFKKKKNGE